MATSDLILQSYFNTASTSSKKGARGYDKKIKQFLHINKKTNEREYLIPLNYYLDILEGTDQVLFSYMNAEKKQILLRDLQIALFLLLAQRKYEQEHQKIENYEHYTNLIKECHQLIGVLQYGQICKERNIKPSPDYGYATDGYPTQFLGLFLGKSLAEQMVNFIDRKTKTIKAAMGALNEKRLYWVWGSGLIKAMLELLPDTLEHLDQAKETIKYPDPYTGALSWGLYYLRFSLNLSLLLKHTIRGPWMSEEEKSTPWTERFLTQWDFRKFTLLNDSVWATGNLACYCWLTGSGTMGTLGDALTLGLLAFDISLAVWDFKESETKYSKEKEEYKKNIVLLDEKLKDSNNTKEDKREYTIQRKALIRAQKKCIKDWEHQRTDLILNVTYAVGLMAAFFILAAPFVPALAYLAPVGAVQCFALTALFNAIKGGVELGRTKNSVKEIKDDLQVKIAEFEQLIDNPACNDQERKFLFLEVKRLMADNAYQQQMVNLQIAHLIRSILIETLIPAIIITNLVLFPAALLSGLSGIYIVGALSNSLIDAIFSPNEKEKLKSFNEEEYHIFCQNPNNWMQKIEKTPLFFSPHHQITFYEPTEEEHDFDMGSFFRTHH